NRFGLRAVKSRFTRSGRLSGPFGLTGCYRGSAFGLIGYACQSYLTCGLFTTYIHPLTTKSVPHLSHSIGTVIFSVKLADVFYHSDIAQSTRAKPASLRLAIATRGGKTTRTVDV